MTPRLRIGLTGGIASGKSTVTQRFAELGVPVIDADVSSRHVVERGEPGLEKIVRRFGLGVLEARLRELPRPILGRLADKSLWLDLRCLEAADEAEFAAQWSSIAR